MDLYAVEEVIKNNVDKPETKEKYARNAEHISNIISLVQKMDPAVVNVISGMLLFDSLIYMFVERTKKEGREYKIEDISMCIDSYMSQVWSDMKDAAVVAHLKMFVVNKVKEAVRKEYDTVGMRPN